MPFKRLSINQKWRKFVKSLFHKYLWLWLKKKVYAHILTRKYLWNTKRTQLPLLRFEGVLYISYMLMFWKSHLLNIFNFWLNSTNLRWPNLSKQETICETRKGPNRTPIRRGIDYLAYSLVLEITIFGQLPVAEFGRNCQKAHLHAKTFHSSQ